MFELLHCVSPETVALCICLPLLAYFICRWAFEKDTALEDRKRAAGLLASKLTALGFVRSPKLLTDFSIGDVPSLILDFEDILNLFLDGEDAVMKEINGVLSSMVGTPDGLALVQAALAKAVPVALAVAAPVAAPIAAAVAAVA